MLFFTKLPTRAPAGLMLKNYLLMAWRSLYKHRAYTFINISGLAVGLACCLLIVFFIHDELSFDRFHRNADRIVRVLAEVEFGPTTIETMPPEPFGPTLVDLLPGVEGAVRIRREGRVVLERGSKLFYEDDFAYADPSLFTVFDFSLAQGDPTTALDRPGTAVVSDHIARTYFGDADPVGKGLTVSGGQSFEVTGVLAEIPPTSHLQFNIIASYATRSTEDNLASWGPGASIAYLLLADGYSPADLERDAPEALAPHLGEPQLGFNYMPLTDVYLHGSWTYSDGLRGDVRYLYLFSAVALLILLIGCINYMNLATARAAWRAREVGVRKAVGASRGQLIRQFLGESFLLVGVAFMLGLATAELLLPSFNALTGKDMQVDYVGNGWLMVLLPALMLLVGLAAGSYPAFFLSAFRPVRVLKGAYRTGRGSGRLRQGLVVFQFAMTVILLIGTLVMQSQLDYIRNARLGFNGEQVVVLRARGDLRAQYAAFKDEVLGLPGVRMVTTSPMPSDGMGGPVRLEQPDGEPQDVSVNMFWVDDEFLETMEIGLVEGRNLSGDRPTDLDGAVLINQAAARAFGWDAPLGRRMDRASDTYDMVTSEVVGVVEDFNYASLRSSIEPLVLMLTERNAVNILVKIDDGAIPQALEALEVTWEAFVPTHPFEYTFLDAQFEAFYRAEQRMGRIFGICAALAVLIACLGLFGLAAFTTEQRTKEIGVRKVLGASAGSIVVLLSREVFRLVVIAFVLAAPLAYLGTARWLGAFAYRITLGPGVFALAGALALLVACLTVGYQALRAARANPVESLRYE